MKSLLPLLLALAVLTLHARAADTNSKALSSPSPSPKMEFLTSVPGESKENHDARMAWWRDAKFGMFIHWGVYSVPAGSYHDKGVGGVAEWIMRMAHIPMAEYQSFAKDFTGDKFDPAAFVATAKAAGMKYIVITAKHHDGFAMYDSKVNDWTIVRASPFKKDPLKALVEECRKQGMKLGFYYSQAQDWNNGGSISSGSWDKAQVGDMDKYIDKTVVPQVTELLTNYGPDTPCVLWWDTPISMNSVRATKIDAVVQKLRPGVIQNNRLGGGSKGDTETPEQRIPPQGYPCHDWETCMTINGTWGFSKNDHNWKSTETIIRNLTDIASKGGNYLLNVGPDSHGVIPEESVKRLAEVGDWMKVNGEAIYGTTATPFGPEACAFSPTEKDKKGQPIFKTEWKWRATQKPGHIYLIIYAWPSDGKFTVPAYLKKIIEARLLADPSAKLTLDQNDQGITISGLPAKAPSSFASVIDLSY